MVSRQIQYTGCISARENTSIMPIRGCLSIDPTFNGSTTLYGAKQLLYRSQLSIIRSGGEFPCRREIGGLLSYKVCHPYFT